jgi:diguanylate cyclase (GGDEF)-like protein
MTDDQIAQLCMETLEHCADALFAWDSRQRIVLFNAAAERLWQRPRREVVGGPLAALLPGWRGHADAATCLEVLIQRGDGEQRRCSIRIARRQAAGQVFHMALVEDRSERRRTSERLRLLRTACDDPLTGLLDRHQLLAGTALELERATREHRPLALLLINLDGFKQVNHSFGHAAGDQLLRLVAERLKQHRGGSGLAGRLSGDEFLLVCPGCDRSRAGALAERLQRQLGLPCPIGGGLMPSTSIGLSLHPDDGLDMQQLLRRASQAVDQVRSAGRGGYGFFSHQLDGIAEQRRALQAALRQALVDGQLRLHYQPQVRFADGGVHGVEALLRWRHPQFGTISPGRLVPLAEECGLIDALGDWVLDQACRQMAKWRSKGLQIASLSINLSPTNLHNQGLARTIADTLRSHGLAPSDLTVEITEGVLVDSGILPTLDALHGLGVRLALDDFGTGYSSLSYLRRLPVSELKLDKSFVDDLESDASSRALSGAVLDIGRSLGLSVVAEGIETRGQYEILRSQGYPVVQGYLICRPRSAARLEEWMAERRRRP